MRKPKAFSMRLYDQALVEIAGQVRPQTAVRLSDRKGVYRIGTHDYHENGSALPAQPPAPTVLLVYSMGCTLVRG